MGEIGWIIEDSDYTRVIKRSHSNERESLKGKEKEGNKIRWKWEGKYRNAEIGRNGICK